MAKVKRQYPADTKISEWYFQSETYKSERIYSVRRVITLPDGKTKLERYPAAEYRDLRADEKKIKDFVTRLNGRDPRAERVKAKLEFNHAFINDEILAEYEEVYLRNYIPNESETRQLTAYLRRYPNFHPYVA